jgi:hypothetical protein
MIFQGVLAMSKFSVRIKALIKLAGKMLEFYENYPFVSTAGHLWERQLNDRFNSPEYLEQYGFKVYSQNDEDGIISEIFHRIGTANKIFIEFGVGGGLECNTHYLLLKGWRGLWIEGDKNYFKLIQDCFASVIHSGQLTAVCEFITPENINAIFLKNGFEGEIDLLSIDIDGNDYYVFDAISAVNPRVVILEYNSKFPPECDWKMEYDKNYAWDGSDRHGASLKALEELGFKKNYRLVGTNYNGVNAFFVRKDLASGLFPSPATAENLYNPLRNVRYVSGHPASKCLI